MAILRAKCYAPRCAGQAVHSLRGLAMCAEHFREAFLHSADVDGIPRWFLTLLTFKFRRGADVVSCQNVAAGELARLSPQLDAQLCAAIARARAKENAL